MRKANTTWTWLLIAVSSHLIVTLIHGVAHARAHVFTTMPQNVFILLIIVTGPLAGLWLSVRYRVLGGCIIAATMTAALVFGLVNHFILSGVDHVDHVTGPWSGPFATSAAVLAITEVAGAIAGIWHVLRRMEKTS